MSQRSEFRTCGDFVTMKELLIFLPGAIILEKEFGLYEPNQSTTSDEFSKALVS